MAIAYKENENQVKEMKSLNRLVRIQEEAFREMEQKPTYDIRYNYINRLYKN